MKIMKYSLMLGVASAFLLSGNLSADEQAAISAQQMTDSDLARMTGGADLVKEVEGTTKAVDAAGAAVDAAEDALRKAKEILVEARETAAASEQAIVEVHGPEAQARAAEEARAKAEADAAELERLRNKTPEELRQEAEDSVLQDHQHRFKTALHKDETTDEVKVTPTYEDKVNKAQAAELRKRGVGKNITAELDGAPLLDAAANDEELKEDAQPADAVAADKPTKGASKKEKKKLTDEEKAEKKSAGKAKHDDRKKDRADAKEAADADDALDTSLNEKVTKEDAKKADKKFTDLKKKAAGEAAGEAKRADRKKRKEENKNTDYTDMLNKSDVPEGEASAS